MKLFSFSLFLLLAASSQLFSQPSDEDFVAWYPFAGNAGDASLHGHDGGVFGATLAADRFGNPASAYFFDGVDDFILVPDHPDLRLGETSYTISVWIRPETISDEQSHTVLSKRSGQGNLGYLFQLIGTEHVMGLAEGAFNIITSGGWNDPLLTTSGQLAPGEWHHVAYEFDLEAGKGQFFLDGEPDASGGMVPGNPFDASELYIGKDKLTKGSEPYPGYFGGYHFHGAIDDLRIYRRKLSEEELAALFEEAASGNGQPQPGSPDIQVNPTLTSGFLQILAENVEIQEVVLTDVLGRTVWKGVFLEKTDVRFLAQGAWFISFFDAGGKLLATRKFVKM